jgi:hypothetical protein
MGFRFQVARIILRRNMYTVNKMIPPIIKEALHEETAEFCIFRTFCPLIIT